MNLGILTLEYHTTLFRLFFELLQLYTILTLHLNYNFGFFLLIFIYYNIRNEIIINLNYSFLLRNYTNYHYR